MRRGWRRSRGGENTAALIVGGGNDRDRLLGNVDAEAETSFVDVRETLNDEGRWFVSNVEPDVV